MQQQMQQPQQPDQIGGQQALGQQMVLCPVRLVYETQILVQPGDHIQPNQTFFINQQNPPPWIQNTLQNSLQPSLQPRPMQNQVVYVQQLPNNMVSTLQQPMDQNQMYLQQSYPNFQMQQPMLTQNPQERPAMQLSNIMSNMVQNIQTSVPNERTIQVRQMQSPQIIQNHIAVHRPVQNQIVNQSIEASGQVFMRPQIQQHNHIQRPMVNINQMQNMQQQTVSQHNVGSNTSHTFTPNTSRQGPNINTVRASMPSNVSVQTIQAVPKIREIVPASTEKQANVNPVGNVAPNVRNFVPTYYKPIQPRPQIHNVSNIPKVSQHIPVQTLQNTPTYNHDRNNTQNTSNNYAIIQELNGPVGIKRRKCDSPDQVVNKTPNLKSNYNNTHIKPNYNTMQDNVTKPNYNPTQNSVSKPNYYVQQNTNTTKIVNEIGTNTSPIHRPKINTQPQVNNSFNTVKNSNVIETTNKQLPSLPYLTVETEKLIRNTVYTQARGRVLHDKSEEIKVQQIEIATETLKPKVIEKNIVIKPQIVEKPVTEVVNTISIVPIQKEVSIKIEKDSENKVDAIQQNVQEIVKKEVKVVEKVEKVEQVEKVEKVEKIEKIEKNENIENKELPNIIEENNIENINEESKEVFILNGRSTVKSDIDILTHVVDGYVIQESNMAFPIRKPLKEKAFQSNKKFEESEKRDLLKESIKEELKSNAVDTPMLPFHYLMLESAKEEKEKAEEKEREDAKERDNPFSELLQSTVKTWSMEELTGHLLIYNWKETVSLLLEHEIDGESLFLVSKQQLTTIGVPDEHADLICEFVKS